MLITSSEVQESVAFDRGTIFVKRPLASLPLDLPSSSTSPASASPASSLPEFSIVGIFQVNGSSLLHLFFSYFLS